jgi:hypothetical protein
MKEYRADLSSGLSGLMKMGGLTVLLYSDKQKSGNLKVTKKD